MEGRFCARTFFSNHRGPRQLNYFPSCRSNILIHVVGQTAGRVRARAYRDWQAEREHTDRKLAFRGLARGWKKRKRDRTREGVGREVREVKEREAVERKGRFKISQSSGKRYSGLGS